MEIQFFFLYFQHPLYLYSRLSRGKIPHSRIIPYKSWNFRFCCFFSWMSGFQDLFYTNFILNSSQLSSVALEFQIFFPDRKKNLYRGWSVFIWNSPLLWLYSADFDKNNEWFQCIVLYAKFWLSHCLCAQWHIVMIINDNNILVCCCYD